MEAQYDVVVIGSGVAGTRVATSCRSAGKNVAVSDEREFGGTCALRGCNPKKALIGAAEVIERYRNLHGKGISGNLEINWPELIRFKRSLISSVPEHREQKYQRAGIDSYHGHARFIDGNTVQVDGRNLTARKIVIADGAKPAPLGITGEELVTTSDEFLEMEHLPDNIVFIGGGYVSFELAHIVARAGAKAKILHNTNRPLRHYDVDIVDMLTRITWDTGIEVHVSTPARSIEKRNGKLVVHAGEEGEQQFEADLVVHGAGRVPNLDDLSLERAHVVVDRKGIVINEHLQSISNPSVYVAGDANAYGIKLTPVASMEGSVVAQNIVNGDIARPDYSAVPSVTFTIPKIASVGLNEQQAQQKGLNYEVHYQDTSHWSETRILGFHHSAYKVIVDPDSHSVIGAHLLGHNVDEVINIFALAIRYNLKIEDVHDTIWTYPTVSYEINYMV